MTQPFGPAGRAGAAADDSARGHAEHPGPGHHVPVGDPGVGGDLPVAGDLVAAARGMRLLAAGVPLTLLLDLSLPVDSTAIAQQEGGSASWLHGEA